MTNDYQKQQIIKNLKAVRGPLIAWMLMVGCLAAFVLDTMHGSQLSYRIAIARQTRSVAPLFAMFSIGSVMLSIWFSPRLYVHAKWMVVGLPLILTWIYSIVLVNGTPVIYIGTYPVFMVYLIIIYDHPHKIFTCITFVYFLVWGAYTAIVGWMQGLIVLLAFVFVMVFVLYFWRIYYIQLRERQHFEDLYNELKLAYAQVEESAVHAERQRVARELHDTLTQGLAGLVMQLEAANSFMHKGQNDRAQEIVEKAIDIARDALRDSRTTLTDLRSTTEESLPARLQLVAEAIDKNYGLNVTVHADEVPDYSPSQLTEITRIVSEALTNVAKHAQTDQAVIRTFISGNVFKLQVIDYGSGFDNHDRKIRKKDHYGLTGLQERAKSLSGVVTVLSTPDEGTTVTLTMPTDRKDLV